MRREYDFSQGTRGKHAGKRLRIVGDTSLSQEPDEVRTTQTRKRSSALDLTARILSTKQIAVSWVYEDTEGFLYNNVPGTILVNASAQSIRFELKEKNGDDNDNFEVVIKNTNGSYILKADHPEMGNQEFPLKVYSASEELVLYLEDANNHAYFHLS
jgi:hypothetical protein